MMQTLRSILFNIFFVSITFFVFTLGCFVLLLPHPYALRFMHWWSASTLWGLKNIVGLTYRVSGLEHVTQPCLIAAKHQSAWDTLIFHAIFDNPCFAAKKELNRFTFGLYFRRFKLIPVDRQGGRKALQVMLAQTRAVLEEQRPIIIFPEGRRMDPGAPPQYQKGIAALYQFLNVPVVPVALNSGEFWGRRSFLKKPGCIDLVFLPPITPGLKADAFMEKLSTDIESQCQRLKKGTSSDDRQEGQPS